MIHINVKLDDDLVEALDTFMVMDRLENRSQALRKVLRLALLADGTTPPTPPTPPAHEPGPVVPRSKGGMSGTKVLHRRARKKVVGEVEPVVTDAATQERMKAAQRVVDGVVGKRKAGARSEGRQERPEAAEDMTKAEYDRYLREQGYTQEDHTKW